MLTVILNIEYHSDFIITFIFETLIKICTLLTVQVQVNTLSNREVAFCIRGSADTSRFCPPPRTPSKMQVHNL